MTRFSSGSRERCVCNVGARNALALEALLDAAPDRESAGRAAIALARLHVANAALLVVHRGMVMGLFGDGGDLDDHIGACWCRSTRTACWRRAASGEPYPARLRRARSTNACCARSVAPTLREIAVLPISVRGRVVNLLYVDGGSEPIAETTLGALHALTLCVARSLRAA